MKLLFGLICAMLLLLPNISLAQTSTTVDVSTEVSEELDLTLWIKRVVDDQDPGTEGTEVTSMAFGPLTNTFGDGSPAGALFSRTWFAAFLIASTSGRPYIIRQTADGLEDGANSIPSNCYLMTPDYIADDEFVWPGGSKAQGDMPTGATLGSPGPAEGTDIAIYTSGTAGESRILRAYYSITNGYQADGTPVPGFSGDAIPLDQPAGDYTGNVTFSVVLQ